MDLESVLAVVDSLERHDVEYAVFGGVAVNLYGVLRATEDLDLFIRPDPSNIERLKTALRDVWDDPCIDEISSDDLCGDYPSVRYIPPEGDFFLDILTRLGNAWHWSDIEVVERAARGTSIRVVTPSILLAMKSDTVRDKDRADVAMLRQILEGEES